MPLESNETKEDVPETIKPQEDYKETEEEPLQLPAPDEGKNSTIKSTELNFTLIHLFPLLVIKKGFMMINILVSTAFNGIKIIEGFQNERCTAFIHKLKS